MKNILRGALQRTAKIVQWGVVALLYVICIVLALGVAGFKKEGVDVTTSLLSIAGMAVVAVGLLPPLFFKFPIRARLGAYALVLVAFAAVALTFGAANEAYDRTPKGTAEAKLERQEADREAAKSMFAEHESNLADSRSKVRQCINWQGQIPSLVKAVKEQLHNPRSFEHVATEMKIVPRSGVPAVVMEYRGENGYGAIRTETVSAFIAPNDCSVLAVKPYEASDFEAN